MVPKVITRSKDPLFWQEVREKGDYRPLRDDLLKKWEHHVGTELPSVTYGEYRLFFETGNRSLYEAKYFLLRRALSLSALLSMIYPEDKQYLSRLEDVIFAICNEYTWCLPAHQPNGTEDITNHIDVFASETAGALAEINEILGERLSPLVRALVRRSVESRVIEPYAAGKTAYPWESSQGSRAAVCASGVAMAVAYIRPDLLPSLLPRIENSMQAFLSGYGDDGFCPEGISSWSYGFGYYAVYADLIRDLTDGAVNGFASPKVAAISSYLGRMYLCGNVVASFSDSPRHANASIGLNHYLYREYPDRVKLIDASLTGFASGCAHFALDLRRVLWFDPALRTEDVSDVDETYYAADAEWYVRKHSTFGFAAKAGHNGEPHNHNDIGSFIIALDRQQIFADIGAGAYTGQYFQDQTRYKSFACGSQGHSVPYFGENHQKHGAAFAAVNVKAEQNTFSLDMAGAYGISALRSLVRSFEIGEHEVRLTDTFATDGTLPITERFILLAEPSLRDGVLTVANKRVTFGESAKKIRIEYTPIPPHGGASRAPTDLWTVDVLLRAGADVFTMRVEL